MAAPSVSGGFTMLNSCDTGGPSGVTPSVMLSGATPATSGARGNGFATGLGGTGIGTFGNGGAGNALQGAIYSVPSTDFTVTQQQPIQD